MRSAAKVYITTVIILGAMMTTAAIFRWTTDIPHLLVLSALAVSASMLKVEIPGVDGTYSLGFVSVLIGICTGTFCETVVIGALCAIVQSLWRPRVRPTAVQVIFSMAAVILSAGTAYICHSAATAATNQHAEVAVLAMVAALYWTLNTAFVSVVVALVRNGNLGTLFEYWCLSTLPYYFVVAGVIAIIIGSLREGRWIDLCLMFPVLMLSYLCWRFWIQRGVISRTNRSLIGT